MDDQRERQVLAQRQRGGAEQGQILNPNPMLLIGSGAGCSGGGVADPRRCAARSESAVSVPGCVCREEEGPL